MFLNFRINAIKEICARCPLAISQDLLLDIVQYKKYKNKSNLYYIYYSRMFFIFICFKLNMCKTLQNEKYWILILFFYRILKVSWIDLYMVSSFLLWINDAYGNKNRGIIIFKFVVIYNHCIEKKKLCAHRVENGSASSKFTKSCLCYKLKKHINSCCRSSPGC